MKRRIILPSVVILISVIGIISYVGIFGNHAPTHVSYYGKPLAYWFKPWRTTLDLAMVSADIALPEPGRGDFNPEAIPFLVKNLTYRQSPFNRLWQEILPRLPRAKRISWLQPVPDWAMRQIARRLLGLIRYNPDPSVPILVKEYQKANGAVRAELAEVLGEIGGRAREALPALRTSTVSPDAVERAAADQAILRIEGDSTIATRMKY